MMEEALLQEPPAVALELEQRFHLFVASHRERARRLAWRLVGGDDAAAEDVVQEAFIKAYRALGQFREEASLATWFYRIVVRRLLGIHCSGAALPRRCHSSAAARRKRLC